MMSGVLRPKPCQPTTSKAHLSATVLRNEPVCREHFWLVLEAAPARQARPGQFLQLLCRDSLTNQSHLRVHDWPAGRLPELAGAELAGPVAFLRRPYSIAGWQRKRAGRSCAIEILYRVVGLGSRWLSSLQPGQPLDLLGPMGNGFRLRPDKAAALLVGGGVGIAPLIWLARRLNQAGGNVVAFCGARTAELLPLRRLPGRKLPDDPLEPARCWREFLASRVPLIAATDDGSIGFAGPVSQAVEAYLARARIAADQTVIYACGPEAMLQALANLSAERRIECQVLVERRMACGMGTCQSCAVRIRDESSSAGWSYRLACLDGPVFDASQVLW